MSKIVGDGISVKLNGKENVILLFKDDETRGEPAAWGFSSREDFGRFVAECQAFYNEITA